MTWYILAVIFFSLGLTNPVFLSVACFMLLMGIIDMKG
jgi:hypothetical protein